MNAPLLALLLVAQAAEPGPRVIALSEMLQRAETQNPDATILRERVEQARATFYRAWAGLLPTATGIAQYTRNSDEAVFVLPLGPGGAPIEVELQPFNQYNVVANASMPVFAVPLYLAIKSAGQAVEATGLSVMHARNELFFGIIQAYYATYATQRVIEVAKRQLDTAKEQERVARARYEAGELAKVAFLRAGVERARAEQDLVRITNQYAAAKLSLAALVGLTEEFAVSAPTAVEAVEGEADALVQRALASRNDLKGGALFAQIAERGVTASLWRFAPVVSVNGQYRWSNSVGFTGENDAWLVSLTAAVPLFDAAQYAQLDEARSKAREAAATLEKVRRQVEHDVKTALLELQSARANLVKASEQDRLAAESEALVQAQFRAGNATYLDVVDSTSVRFSAGVGVINEELNVQLASLKLAKAIGELDAKL